MSFILISCSADRRFGRGVEYKAEDSPKEQFTRSRPSGRATAYEEGISSYYGPKFHGKTTASGEKFDMYQMTAAHKTLPFDTCIKVTNMDNGKSVIVKINDRGPFVKNRILDLSYGAAKKIDMIGAGTARVRIEIIESCQ